MVNGRAEALVPDAVPLEDSGDALEPPAKRVCSSDTFATPPNKFVNLETDSAGTRATLTVRLMGISTR